MVTAQKKQNIPNGWKETKLSKLLVEVNERNREHAELPVLSVTNSRGFVLQSEQFARNLHSKNTSNYKIVSKEQFAYNPARINVGSIALLRKWEKGLLSPMYVVFSTKDELLNDYLQYYIQSPRFSVQVSNNTAGSVRKSLNFNAFEHFDYVYPESKQEQKKIVEVLASVDEEMQKTKEVIKATEKLKKGLMQKLFTQGIGHTKFKQTELGEIPDGWKLRRLGDIADISRGGSPRPIEAFITSDSKGYNWLKIGDIKPGSKYVYETKEKIKKEGLTKTTLVEIGDFILSNSMSFGRPYIMKTNACIHDGWLAFKNINSDIIDKEYLYYLLLSDYVQKSFYLASAGSGVKNLKKETVSNVLVAISSPAEQGKVVEIMSSVDDKLAINKKLLAKQTELKKGLMQDLLSGVKRVTI